MIRFFFPPQAAIIIGILLVASFGYSLIPTTHADSSNTGWQLTVTGLVEHPVSLTLTDLLAMPQTTVYAQLIGVGPPPFLVTEGGWTGVRLWLLLQEAGVLHGVVKVAFYAADNYTTTDLDLWTAQRDDVILAYSKDGVPLDENLRLVVPGQSDYKWIKDVTGIKLVDYDFLGLYESNGSPDVATISGCVVYPILAPSLSASTNLSNSLNPVPSQTQSTGASGARPQTTSPNASPPIQKPRPPAEIELGGFLPIEFFYAIAAIFIVIIVGAAFTVKNRSRAHTQRTDDGTDGDATLRIQRVDKALRFAFLHH